MRVTLHSSAVPPARRAGPRRQTSAAAVVAGLALLIGSAGSGQAQSPGWRLADGHPVSPARARAILHSLTRSRPATLPERTLPTAEAAVDDAIVHLADALENDPARMFDYVRNYIEYVPVFGSVQGAAATSNVDVQLQ